MTYHRFAVWPALLSLSAFLVGCAGTASLPSADPTAGTTGTSEAVAAGAQRTQRTANAVYPAGALKPITLGEAHAQGVVTLAPPADLWERIRRGFAMPDLQTELVADREQWYATRPDYIQRMTERSSKYLFHIVEELERRGMPSELALLPYIESAFNPQAVSSAKAAGMWQFMPATGNDFRLKQNLFRDDRRDVLASTRAALDYLQRLYNQFGDWHLALAAYNWGEGSVARAIARNQKQGLPTGYTDLSMPNETRYYVPKLQAVKNIVAHPELFNAELPAIENHPYFQSVAITRDIDVAMAAKLADVRPEDFRALNPSMRHPVILASGTPQILLPWDNAAVFQRNLQAHADGQTASWTAWTVPATMNVSAVAQKVGMSEADLRQVNAIPPRMLVKAGSTLVVRRGEGMQDDVAAHVADNGHLSLAPEVVTRRITVKAGRRDTVASVAQRYRLSPTSVAGWNDVNPSAVLRSGQQLIVYVPVSAAAAAAPAPAASVRAAAPVPAPSASNRNSAGRSQAAPNRKAAAAPAAARRTAVEAPVAKATTAAAVKRTSAPAPAAKKQR